MGRLSTTECTYLPTYTDPKHFGSTYFDIWNSLNNHGGSRHHDGAAIHGPKEPFLALVWTDLRASCTRPLCRSLLISQHECHCMSGVHVCVYYNGFQASG